MASVVRFSIDDHRITYSAGWRTIYNFGVGKNETFVYSYTGAELFFMFRGIAHEHLANGLPVTSYHHHGL